MQGTILHTNGADANMMFNFATSVAPTPDVVSHLRDNHQSFINNLAVSNSNFAAILQEQHDYNISNNQLDIAREVMFQTNNVLNDYSIHKVPYDGLAEMNATMQRYTMAHPTLYTLYENNRCSGFDDSWHDSDKVSARWRDDYIQVMDGMMEFKEDGGLVTHYYAETPTLTLGEKSAILDVWRQVEGIVADGYDPTDLNKGKL